MRPSSILLSLALLLTFIANADTVILESGRQIKGELKGATAGYISIQPSNGASNVELRFSPREVDRILFSDTDLIANAERQITQGNLPQAISLLETLTRKRLPYFGNLTQDDERFFVSLLEAYLESGRETDCLERAKVWSRSFQFEGNQQSALEVQIVASTRLNQSAEAVVYAHQWIDQNWGSQGSAIAWATLSEALLDQGDPQNAFWQAIQPIAFSRNDSTRHLNRCYEIAIAAALELENLQSAKSLYAEMLDRSLTWPIRSKRADLPYQLERLEVDPSFPAKRSSSASVIPSFESVPKLSGQP